TKVHISSSPTQTVCVVAMMMMMMITEAAAMPKARTHKKTSDDSSVEIVQLQFSRKSFASLGTGRPLESASISPWTYNVSFDDSLFPSTLSEARCLLTGCLDAEGQEDLSLESRPIMHQVQLLRRVRSSGAGSEADTYHYRLETRLIAVGCTCVRPTVHRQQ
ncbi:hypothetical protein L3Q82_008431, partial [Scortum barcoo]